MATQRAHKARRTSRSRQASVNISGAGETEALSAQGHVRLCGKGFGEGVCNIQGAVRRRRSAFGRSIEGAPERGVETSCWRKSVALSLRGENHPLAPLLDTVAHYSDEFACRLTYYSLLSDSVVAQCDNALRADWPDNVLRRQASWGGRCAGTEPIPARRTS